MVKCYHENYKIDSLFHIHSQMFKKFKLVRLKEIIFDIEYRNKKQNFCELLRILYQTSSFNSIILSDINNDQIRNQCYQILYKEYFRFISSTKK